MRVTGREPLFKRQVPHPNENDMSCYTLSQGITVRNNTAKHQRTLDGLLWHEHARNAMLAGLLCAILLLCDASGSSAGAILMPSSVLLVVRDSVTCSHLRQHYAPRKVVCEMV